MCSSSGNLSENQQSHNGHLSAFARRIVFVAEALSHDLVYGEASPKENTHFSVLSCSHIINTNTRPFKQLTNPTLFRMLALTWRFK
jgi:hypothetical protein